MNGTHVSYYKNLSSFCHSEGTKTFKKYTPHDEERDPEARLNKTALSGVQNPSSFWLHGLFPVSLRLRGIKKVNNQFNSEKECPFA